MDRNNPVYKQLILEHGSISHAARKFGLTRKAIYDFIAAGKISQRAKNSIINSGHNPVTFEPVLYAKKET